MIFQPKLQRKPVIDGKLQLKHASVGKNSYMNKNIKKGNEMWG